MTLSVGDGMERATARTIASMVEEKVLRIGLNKVPTSLIRELVEIETTAILECRAAACRVRIKNRKRTVAPTYRHGCRSGAGAERSLPRCRMKAQ